MERGSRPASPMLDSSEMDLDVEATQQASTRDTTSEQSESASESSSESSPPVKPRIPNSKPHGGITDEDKHALANFIVTYPQKDKSWPEYMKVFEKKVRTFLVRNISDLISFDAVSSGCDSFRLVVEKHLQDERCRRAYQKVGTRKGSASDDLPNASQTR